MCCLGQDALWRLLPTLQETLHTHPDVALALVYSNPTKQRHAAGTCACSPLAKVESLKSLVPLRTMFEPWCSCLLHKVEWSKVLHWTQMQEWRCTTSARQLSTHSTHHGHTGAAELYAVTTIRNLDPHTWCFLQPAFTQGFVLWPANVEAGYSYTNWCKHRCLEDFQLFSSHGLCRCSNSWWVGCWEVVERRYNKSRTLLLFDCNGQA